MFNVDQAAQQGFEAVAWVLSVLNSFAGVSASSSGAAGVSSNDAFSSCPRHHPQRVN